MISTKQICMIAALFAADGAIFSAANAEISEHVGVQTIAAIRSYCDVKAYLPATDSYSRCIQIAKKNAQFYRVNILEPIEARANETYFVVPQLRDLKRRIKHQATVASIDLSHWFSDVQLNQLIDQAINDSRSGNAPALLQTIAQAKKQLQNFEANL